MVMADYVDRGRRKRRRGGMREDYEYMQPLPSSTRQTMILSKTRRDKYGTNSHVEYTNGPLHRSDPLDIAYGSDRPPMGGPSPGPGGGPVVLKTRDRSEDGDSRRHLSASRASPSPASVPPTSVTPADPGSPKPQQMYTIQRSNPSHTRVDGGASVPLPPPPEMSHSIKLVDESLMWCESGMEMLLDQTNFLVVGVIGMQGSGKSSLMSHLAGCDLDDPVRSFVFRPQCKEARETCAHQSQGIDMYVTGERTILLDSQAVLSPSLLDHLIHHDKKYPTEYSSAENCIEIQSLQVASFMYTVCNVVLVVLDWFVDMNLIRFLETAEMLKPATPSPTHDSQDDLGEYYPHLVFVLNKAGREDFSVESYAAMQRVLSQTLAQSKLKIRGGPCVVGSKMVPALNLRTIPDPVNLILLPDLDNNNNTSNKEEEDDLLLDVLKGYRGHPTYDSLLTSLRKQILAVPRQPLTPATLSEKNWFHYATKTWDSLHKSQLFSEYNRLLP